MAHYNITCAVYSREDLFFKILYNEHESRFFFDLIYNNTSEIQPDIFSTDTEGSNQLNFLLLHLKKELFVLLRNTLNYQI